MNWLGSLGTPCNDNIDMHYLELHTISPAALCFSETLTGIFYQRVSSWVAVPVANASQQESDQCPEQEDCI